MNISRPFITRPAGTSLLVVAIALAGILACLFLPVSPLAADGFTRQSASMAGLPGASPETMASSVATPLERQLGRHRGHYGNDARLRVHWARPASRWCLI